MSRGRILIADDSAFVRKVLRDIVTRAGYEVVDVARDGLEALEKTTRLLPDVLTLDLMMPHLDGIGVLRALAEMEDAPAVVVVSISGQNTEIGVSALQLGALALVEKPTATASGRLYEMEESLLDALRVARSAQRYRPPSHAAALPRAMPVHRHAARTDLVVVGASTGGPQALTRLLSGLPGDLPVPLAMVLHIPPGYTEPFARRLNEMSALEVVEAEEGMEIVPGRAVVARAGIHLLVARKGADLVAHMSVEPILAPHRPSVDSLFQSASDTLGERVLGVVLTGMGNDGLEGARSIRERGGRVIVESESSSVVWGMPRVVFEAGLANAQAPIESMIDAILEWL